MTYNALKNKNTLEFRTSNAPDGRLLAAIAAVLAALLLGDVAVFGHGSLLRPSQWPLHFIGIVTATLAFAFYASVALGRERHVFLDQRERRVRIRLTGQIFGAQQSFKFAEVQTVSLSSSGWVEGEKEYEVRLHFANGRSAPLGEFTTYFGALRCQEDIREMIGCRAVHLA